MTISISNKALPDQNGYFGDFGGAYNLPPELITELTKVAAVYNELKTSAKFQEDLKYIRKHYQGRPTPITFCKHLSEMTGGAAIYLKREDLNHTGAHKLNHAMGEGLLAIALGKKKLIAETGAGSHGVAVATAAAYFGLECDIYMGEVDIEKQAPNVARMKLLGTRVVPVSKGTKTLKDAVDASFAAYVREMDTALYTIGSVVGPHPFPMIIRDFQSIVGQEAKEQFKEITGKLPDNLVACVGGGSNSIGLFSAFLNDDSVAIYGVEPMGKGEKIGDNAATITFGKTGVLHGFKSLVLQDTQGNVQDAYSIASGLDYPGVGPEHAYLHETGRVKYVTADDAECIDAFYKLTKKEGIIPALESAHAVAYALRLAKTEGKGKSILVNLSGRGDKDVDFVIEHYGLGV